MAHVMRERAEDSWRVRSLVSSFESEEGTARARVGVRVGQRVEEVQGLERKVDVELKGFSLALSLLWCF